MAVPLNVTQIPPFDPNGETTDISRRWRKWIRNFERMANAAGCQDLTQKRDLLLHAAGDAVQDIFDTFGVTDSTYEDTQKKLDTHFSPYENIPFNRHVFRQCDQREGESIIQFVTRLRELANACKFGDSATDFIRDQVIDKCKSRYLRTKLLAEKRLTLDRLLEIAQAKEASEHQANKITSSDRCETAYRIQQAYNRPSTGDTARKFGKSRSMTASYDPQHARTQNQRPQCTRCGLVGHTGDKCRCTKGKQCYTCGGSNHFAVMCRSENKQQKNPNRPRQRQVNPVKNPNYATNMVNGPPYVQQLLDTSDTSNTDNSESEDDLYVFTLTSEPTPPNTLTACYITALIEDEPINMLVDSGSSCNIVNTDIATRLRDRGAQFQKRRHTIYPYGSPPLVAKQTIVADIRLSTGEAIPAEFLVIHGNGPPCWEK